MRLGLLIVACAAFGQTPPAAAPLSIDLANAIERAKAFSPQFQAAGIATLSAREDRRQAKAGLLPNVSLMNQYTYTQGNGTSSGVFAANNGVRLYDEQVSVHADVFSASKLADYRRTIATESAARARQSIATRGLVNTVIQAYYAVVAAQRRVENARRSLEEAKRFEDITQKQERGGEVARADVVKARLQLRERERDLLESTTNVDKAKLGLAVLLFADLAQQFSVVDDLSADLPLSTGEELQQQAFSNNPEIQAAEAGITQAAFGVQAARGGYFPTVVADYFFGLDSNFFAARTPDGLTNLGSSFIVGVNVPVWNWGATRSKVRQSELQRRQANLDLNFTRRNVRANAEGLYLEAAVARNQLASLRDTVNLAAESLRLTLLRYSGGEANALEVVDAQTSAALARNAHADGLARFRVALASIQVLAGKF